MNTTNQISNFIDLMVFYLFNTLGLILLILFIILGVATIIKLLTPMPEWVGKTGKQ